MRKVTFKSLSIRNFLSVGDSPVIIDFKDGINLITGRNLDKPDAKNGAGKSTIIDAFSFAPHGNGVDCHRIWECLYLKTVPIVQYNECFSQFKHLPILYVEDWSEISINFLREKYLKYEHFNLDILELNVLHWKNVITS